MNISLAAFVLAARFSSIKQQRGSVLPSFSVSSGMLASCCHCRWPWFLQDNLATNVSSVMNCNVTVLAFEMIA